MSSGDAALQAPPPAWTLPAVLVLLVVINLLNNRALPAAYTVTCLVGAGLLLAVARLDGCSWTELGLGRETVPTGLRYAAVLAGAVLIGYAVFAALPPTRDAFVDRRVADLSGAVVAWRAIGRVALGTALLEEVAFRGVLYAMLARRYGLPAAIGISSLLFGLWHVLPSLGLPDANAAVRQAVGGGAAGTVLAVLAAVVGTALAGVLFCELRRRSGSLLAPFALHWALNGFGTFFAWLLSSRAA
jgi:membrane protease YdiL (CAAX protease family)